MSEYIVTCDEETAAWIGNDVDSMQPIVRCRDCVHYREEYEECMRGLPSGNVVIFDCESHDFCSFGKRKE